ncbi:MAG: hypothetical protein QNL81_05630, partial [Euryarchaeota archaeon]
IGCENPKELAKDIINNAAVYGISFPSGDRLQIQTHNLNAVHRELPALIVTNGHKVSSIDNPDDDLESILNHLTGGLAR